MKEVLLTIGLTLFVGSVLLGQNVIVEAKSEGEEVILIAQNNEDSDYEVTIRFDTKGYGIKRGSNVVKLIPSKETTEIGRYKKRGKRKSYFKYSYEIKKKSRSVKNESGEKTSTTDDPDLYIYSKDGCGRCLRTIEFLNANNIFFVEKNISNDPKSYEELTALLFDSGFKGGKFSTPVIVVEGNVNYSIRDLDNFLQGLK